MKLPIYRPINHLSHSSIMEWRRCQYLFYMKRMSEHDWPDTPQGKAAAVGSVFDVFVKAQFASININIKKALLDELDPENFNSDIVNMGRALFDRYVDWGMLDSIIEKGLSEVSFKKQGNFGDVPMLGFPDGRFLDGSIMEWKVRGAFSSTGTYNNKGYKFRIVNGKKDDEPHPDCNQPIDILNSTWAHQLAIYDYFSYGDTTLTMNTPVIIDEIAIRPGRNEPRIGIARIESFLTPEYKKKVLENLYKDYSLISEGDIKEPNASSQKCHMWGQICPVADKCPSYQAKFGVDADPVFKDLMS